MAHDNDSQSPLYELPKIHAVSPSLAETLRNCPLQAALSRLSVLSPYILGNPKAWLGIAYHQVLEQVWGASQNGLTNGDLVEKLWQEAINGIWKQAIAHPLNRRFGNPGKWPGYNLARAFVKIRAREALGENRTCAASAPCGEAQSVTREKQLTALGGKLVGRPDVIIGDEIRDYKSGRVYEESATGLQTVKEGYIRQLRLYGHLVCEWRGRCPTKGKLLPMQGDVVEVTLDAATCAAEAFTAVNLLDYYNATLCSATNATELATPSPQACRWCQFKALCLAFWGAVNEGWVNDLGSACVRGMIEEVPTTIHNGQAISLAVSVETGTVSREHLKIAPFPTDVHPHLSKLCVGDGIRIVNLYLRRDGQLASTLATLCFPEAECPRFTVPASTVAGPDDAI